MPSPSSEVIRKFQKRLDTSTEYYRELLLAVHQKRRQASLETMLAEQFTLNTIVLWEVFLSDLFMAYVVEDPTKYMRGLRERMEQSVKERFGGEAARCVTFDLPDVIAMARVSHWLDPKNFNLTFKSASALQARANDVLAAQFAKKFSVDQTTGQFLDFAIALRNYLAHRSPASRGQLKVAASALSGAHAGLNVPIRDVGAFLKSKTGAGDTRAAVLATQMRSLAATFA